MDKWILRTTEPEFDRNKERESLWTQGNGYMGVRASFEESYTKSTRTTLMNGLFDCPKGEVPELAVLPDATGMTLELNGEVFSMLFGKVKEFFAELNMKNGEFRRSLVWETAKGEEFRLEFSRFVSDSRKHILAQKVAITPLSGDGTLLLVTGVDGKATNTGVQHFDNPQKRAFPDGINGVYLSTLQSEVDVAIHYAVKTDKESRIDLCTDRRSLFSRVQAEIKQGETITLEKMTAYHMSRDAEYAKTGADMDRLQEDGIAQVKEATALGYDKLMDESAASWEEFWNHSMVEVHSNNGFIDQAVLFSQYHLHIMASKDDNRLGIGAKALSGEGYMGHSFWDTEMFIFPYYLFTNPDTARRLLEYRYQLLPIAKKKAKEQGYLGAMYPWETAWITDGECCIRYSDMDLHTGKRRRFTMPEDEIHITAGIAFAVWQYYCATKDEAFMEAYGNELLVETAIFWATRAEKKNGRYEICGVIGADEYTEDVDNNAYTNYMAQLNLVHGARILKDCPKALKEKLSKDYQLEELTAKICDVAEKLYLPQPDENGLISQFDGCYDLKKLDITYYKNLGRVFAIFDDYPVAEVMKLQVYKQADLVMLFYLMRERFDRETLEKNFRYYEERTLHDSSLSMCIHALVAAQLGMEDMADKLYYDTCCVDLGENTRNSDGGIHSASIGGIWLATIMGYGGLQIREDGLSLSPVLPKGWDSYSFYVYHKGTKLHVTVNQNGCEIQRILGDSVTLKLYEKEMLI